MNSMFRMMFIISVRVLTYSGVMVRSHRDDLVIELPLDGGAGNPCHMTVEEDVHPAHR